MTGVALVTSGPVGGLAALTRSPDLVCTGPAAVSEALSTGVGWLWLLAPHADPRPAALEALLAAAASAPAPRAAVVAGAGARAEGAIDAASLPGFSVHEPDVGDLSRLGLALIRHAPFINCLVAADAFAEHGLPDAKTFGPFAATAWTAQVLRDRRGYFTADSRVVLSGSAPGPGRMQALGFIARMLRSGAWSRGDALVYVRRGADAAGRL